MLTGFRQIADVTDVVPFAVLVDVLVPHLLAA